MPVVDQSKHLLPLVSEYWDLWCTKGRSQTDRRLGILTDFAQSWDGQRPFRARNSLDAIFIEEWLAETTEGKALKTRSKYAGFVRSFLEWGIKHRLPWREALMFDPGKVSSEREKDPVWLDMGFIRDLWGSQPDWYWRGVIALTTLMLRRQGEMITLRLEQIDMRNRTVRYDNHKTGVKGKTVQFTPWLFEELERYLIAYANHWAAQENISLIREIETWRDARGILPDHFFLLPRTWNTWHWETRTHELEIFPEDQRGSLSEQIGKRITDALPRGSRTEGVGAHTLRRSAALAMFNELVKVSPTALRFVSRALGHKDTRTTEVYLNINDEEVAANQAIAAMEGWGVEDDAPTPDGGGKIIPLRASS